MSFKWLDRSTSLPGPCLTLVTNEEDFLKAMKHLNVASPGSWLPYDGSPATAHYYVSGSGEQCVVVTFQDPGNQSNIEIACLLVHQAAHVMQHYFEHICERNPASEQQAYAIQIVSQQLMEEYVRQKFTTKKDKK